MKTTFSFVLLMAVMISSVSAKNTERAGSHKKAKDKKMTIVDVEEKSGTKLDKKAEAPCDTNAQELMKKLEEEQKKKAAKGQAFGLQGNNSSGCTIGN